MSAPEPDRRHLLRTTFDRTASVYRAARPGYPSEVFALLIDRCGLGLGSVVLEIGAGTGQATMPILELGAEVTAIEPGTALARELEARTVGRRLRIINSTFEDATVQASAFDIVVSATAFHWVDPDVRFHKSAHALRDQGWLAVWSNVYGDPDRPDPFHDAIQPLIKQYAPELLTTSAPGWHPASRHDADPSGEDFDEAEEHVFRWEGHHDPQQVRALFSTFSPWIALPVGRRESILDAIEGVARDKFGGHVTRPYRTVARLWQRKTQ